MTDLLGYKGKRVVIAGCFSGMGEACARLLNEAGAEVHGVDIKPSPVALASFTQLDLKDTSAIEAVAASIGGAMDAVFNCAGLPQTFQILADEIQGIRAVGSLTELMQVQAYVARRIEKARRQIDHHPVGAGLGVGRAGDSHGRFEISGHFLAGSQGRRVVGR